jgi:glycine/D-amino acid oxidase-like deaminating enzyme
VTECDAAIVGSGTVGLTAAYHIKQPRTDERVPAIGRMGNTAKYAHAEKPKSR